MTIFAPKKPTKLATIAAAVVWVLLVACTHQTPHPNDDSYKPRLQLETKNTSLVKNAAEARCFTCGFVETATAAIKNTCIDVTDAKCAECYSRFAHEDLVFARICAPKLSQKQSDKEAPFAHANCTLRPQSTFWEAAAVCCDDRQEAALKPLLSAARLANSTFSLEQPSPLNRFHSQLYALRCDAAKTETKAAANQQLLALIVEFERSNHHPFFCCCFVCHRVASQILQTATKIFQEKQLLQLTAAVSLPNSRIALQLLKGAPIDIFQRFLLEFLSSPPPFQTAAAAASNDLHEVNAQFLLSNGPILRSKLFARVHDIGSEFECVRTALFECIASRYFAHIATKDAFVSHWRPFCAFRLGKNAFYAHLRDPCIARLHEVLCFFYAAKNVQNDGLLKVWREECLPRVDWRLVYEDFVANKRQISNETLHLYAFSFLQSEAQDAWKKALDERRQK